MLLREKQFARDADHFWSKQNETFDVRSRDIEQERHLDV
jgi:hypothetical protein